MNEESTFLGRGWGFPPAFDPHSRAVEMVHDNHDIQESLRILLSTTPGERVMEPRYGCDLSPLAFQKLDLNLETFMISNIKKAILYYEPRIHVQKIQLDQEDMIEGTITINISYTIKATNTAQNLVFPYYFVQSSAL
ncbi:MAG: GPW/gp25 family protein [Bacteroidota bacterium]